MDRVHPHLFISDLPAASNPSLLASHKITHVLSALSGPPVQFDDHIQVHRLDLTDLEDSDLLTPLPAALDFIDTALSPCPTPSGGENNVLVHCQAGVSRSGAIVVAWIMRARPVGVEEALRVVREVRADVAPNEGFLHQLKLFEQAGWVVDAEHPEIRRFFLLQRARDVAGPPRPSPSPSPSPAPAPAPSHSTPSIHGIIRCKKCRINLAPASSLIIAHHPRVPFYLAEPLPWMALPEGEVAGKLYCPNGKCRAKLGAFDWAGSRDGVTGRFVTPAFLLHPTKAELAPSAAAPSPSFSLQRTSPTSKPSPFPNPLDALRRHPPPAAAPRLASPLDALRRPPPPAEAQMVASPLDMLRRAPPGQGAQGGGGAGL